MRMPFHPVHGKPFLRRYCSPGICFRPSGLSGRAVVLSILQKTVGDVLYISDILAGVDFGCPDIHAMVPFELPHEMGLVSIAVCMDCVQDAEPGISQDFIP